MPQYELNLRDYLRIFRKRKFIIVATFVSVTIGSVLHVSMKPLVYESSATVKILERKTVSGLLTEWMVYSPADTMASQAKMIKGFPVMKEVAFDLGLVSITSPVTELQRMVTDLQSKVTTQTVERTNIIKITATASSAEEARDIATAVVNAFIEVNLEEKRKQFSTAREFIQEQLSELEARLKEGEIQLQKFTTSSEGGVNLSAPLQKRLADLEVALAALLQKYTEKHPRVVQTKKQIKDLEAQLKERQEKGGLSEQELEFAKLTREVEANRKLYSMLKEKLEEARITEAQKVGDVSIVDPAVLPRSPVSPRKTTTALVGIIAGAIMGISLAFLVESLDTSVGTIQEVEDLLKLPVLGVIPSIKHEIVDDEKNIFAKIKHRIFRVKYTEEEERYIRMLVHFNPTSSIAESYRNIRTNLKISSTQKVLLVTSAGPGEGKTTILTNLGLTLAQKGARTLLVSSDLRRPALSRTFGIDRGDVGLSEVITGTVPVDDALKTISDIMLGKMSLDDIIRFPGLGNIWILPSGHLPQNPAEILESNAITKLIEDLKRRFDVVLFDSPPVIPVTDPSLLASHVDGVVLCHEIGRTSKDALLRAKTQLESVGAKIIGVVLNHIAAQTESIEPYPYYYKYKYYREEGETDQKKKT
ncbi:MAG: GNVR domain-containing protein [Candidatus Omnitrophota bacterium]